MSTNNQYRIAIIGPEDVVSGFAALGVETRSAQTGVAALEQLRAIKQHNDSTTKAPYAVVCIIESLAAEIDQTEYTKVVTGALPAVVLLPGPEGTQGLALARLRRLAEQAIGSSII